MSPFLSGRVSSWSRVRPVARRKPSTAWRRGVGAGALALLAGVGGAVGEAGEREGQAARRGEGGGVGVGEAALDQAVGDEAAQVVGRLPLHAGGDFLGEEFEQEVGHRGASGGADGQTGSGAGGQGGNARRLPSARLRARGCRPPDWPSTNPAADAPAGGGRDAAATRGARTRMETDVQAAPPFASAMGSGEARPKLHRSFGLSGRHSRPRPASVAGTHGTGC